MVTVKFYSYTIPLRISVMQCAIKSTAGFSWSYRWGGVMTERWLYGVNLPGNLDRHPLPVATLEADRQACSRWLMPTLWLYGVLWAQSNPQICIAKRRSVARTLALLTSHKLLLLLLRLAGIYHSCRPASAWFRFAMTTFIKRFVSPRSSTRSWVAITWVVLYSLMITNINGKNFQVYSQV